MAEERLRLTLAQYGYIWMENLDLNAGYENLKRRLDKPTPFPYTNKERGVSL